MIGMSDQHAILPPDQAELDASWERFDDDWGGVDDILYQLCRDHPGHETRRVVTAKLALVGRVYAAGLERRVTPPAGEQAITVIAEHVLKYGSQVDDLIHGLDAVREPLDAVSMATIVAEHGRLMTLLQKCSTDGKAPRSFASKYLHFHQPAVPIYDEYARQKLSRLVHWERSYVAFDPPACGDRDYWDYCIRFFRLYDGCRAAGLRVSVKTLDVYLWAVPTSAQPGA